MKSPLLMVKQNSVEWDLKKAINFTANMNVRPDFVLKQWLYCIPIVKSRAVEVITDCAAAKQAMKLIFPVQIIV